MPQMTGDPQLGIGGQYLGIGVQGSLVHLFGPGDPNLSSAPSIASASVGSLFSRLDGSTNSALYVKTAYSAGTPGTWTAK